MALLSLACLTLAFVLPSIAQAAFVPTVRDSLAYDTTYAQGSGAFPGAVALGPAGLIYYPHSDSWAPEGTPAYNWVLGITQVGSEVFRVGSDDAAIFNWPSGIDARNDVIVVADTENHTVEAYDPSGVQLWEVGQYGTEPMQFASPAGVAVAANGDIYVADTYNHRIQRLSSSGSYLGMWDLSSQGVYPDGIAIAPNGNLWVALQGSNKVCEYDLSWSPAPTLVRTITEWQETDHDGNPTGLPRTFDGPVGIAVDPFGVVYVADAMQDRIVRFATDGQWLGTFTAPDIPAGGFGYMSDIDVDGLGNVYVSDATADAIYKLRLVMADQDSVPPVTTSNIPDAWAMGPFEVMLSANDASSAVTATYYSVDDSGTVTYGGPFSISKEGTTTVRFHSVDAAENEEAIKTKILRVDSTPPSTTVDCPAVTYGTQARVNVAAHDALSGVASVLYSVDGGTPQFIIGGVGSFDVFGIASHTIRLYAQDFAGNLEPYQDISMVINAPDTAAPVTTSNIPMGWTNQDHTLTLAASDNGGSGVVSTYLSVDGSTPTSDYAGPVNITQEGTNTVKFYSTDLVGNVESVKTELLRIDKTKPTGYSDVQQSYISSATVQIYASDAISGVLDVAYELDGSGVTQHGTRFTVNTVGNHRVDWYVTDNAGNQMARQTQYFLVLQPDGDPPISGDNVPGSWVRGPYKVRIDSYDEISGVDGIYYSTDGTTPTVKYTPTYADGRYSIEFDMAQEGIHTIKYFSVDTRGNAEQMYTRTLKLDNTPPNSTTNAVSSYMGTANIVLNASDALSAIQSLNYSVDKGAWVAGQPGDQVSVSTVGNHTIDYYAKDVPGNREETRTVQFTVTPPDTTPPVTTMSGGDGWARGPRIVSLNAVDASSTVANTTYSLDGSTPNLLYLGGITLTQEGVTTVKYRSTDQWGNVEAVQTGYVRVDNSAPVTTSDVQPSYVDQAQLNLTAVDPYSGVSQTYYRLDGGPLMTGTVVNTVGYANHSVSFYSVDNIGNAEAAKTVNFTIRRRDVDYQQDDPNILYFGTWTDSAGGAAKRSVDASSSVWFWTQAGRLQLFTYGSTSGGIARLRVDGGEWQDVDFYTTSANSYAVWDSGDLPFGYHLLQVENTDRRNPASSGNEIGLDFLRVEGNLTAVPDDAPPTTTSDINESWQEGPVSVTLTSTDTTTGVQSIYYSTDGSAPSLLYSSPVQVTKEGITTFKYYAVDRRGNSEAVQTRTIRIDNSAPNTTHNASSAYFAAANINLTAADQFSSVAYTKYSLDGGAWTTGTVVPVPTATGSHALRYFSADILGHLEATKTANFVVYARSDHTDPKILYRGTWQTANNPGHYGSASRTTAATGEAIINFSGTGMSIISARATDMGIAEVSVDGGAWSEIDLYSITSDYQRRVFTVSGLQTAQHTVRMRWTGRKNAAATSTKINLDAVDIDGAISADTLAPVSTTDYDGTWRKSPVSVTLSALDTHSWVSGTFYRTAGGGYSAYLSPVVISNEGVTTLEFYSVDGAGNTETPSKTASVRIDYTAPVTSHSAPSAWTNGPVEVVLSGDDSASGLKEIRYRIGDSVEQVYGVPIAISAEGTTVVTYYGVDVAGNEEAPKSATVRIDDSAPASGDNAPVGWQKTPVTLTLDSNDPLSGVSGIAYAVDGSSESTYQAPVVIDAEGTHHITYRSVDFVGNAEATRTATVMIDLTAPSTQSDAVEDYTGSAVISLTATDALSGVAKTEYRVDGGSWTEGTQATVESIGDHVFEWRSTDVAGNVESANTHGFNVARRYESSDAKIYLNGSWYTTSNEALSSGSDKWLGSTGSATIVFNGTGLRWIGTKSPYYGIADVSIDGGPAVQVDMYADKVGYQALVHRISGLSAGQHTVRISWTGTKNAVSTGTVIRIDAVDVVGEIAPADVTAPVTTSNINATWRSTIPTVYLHPSDDLVGVATTFYRVAGGSVTTYTAPFPMTAEGTTTVEFWSVDKWGNTETTKTATLRTDYADPITTHVANTAWSKGPQSVVLSGADVLSGLKEIRYSIAGAKAQSYSGPIYISAEGTTTVSYCGVDVAGNVEETKTVDIRIDNTAPVSSDEAPGAWQPGSVDVTLTASDSLSGVSALQYSIDGAPAQVYEQPVAVSGEGTHEIRYSAVDSAGNAETTRTATVRIDLTAPNTTSDAVACYSGSAVINLTSTDSQSGVASTEYSLDGAAWIEGATATADVVGNHQLRWRSSDEVGNVESIRSCTFDVARRVEQSDSRIHYSGNWYTTNNESLSGGSDRWLNSAGAATVAFRGTGVNWVGTKSPFYGIAEVSIDGGAPVQVDMYATSVGYKSTVHSVLGLADGDHTMRIAWTGLKNAASTGTVVRFDAADVVGDLRSADSTAPVTVSNIDPAWRTSPASVTFSATDDLAGVAATYYSLGESAAATYTAPINVTAEGTTTVRFWSVDKWGNTEPTQTAQVRIDRTAPALGDTAPDEWVTGPVLLDLTASDLGSGVDGLFYSTDGSDPSVPYVSPIVVTAEGTSTIRYAATDAVGNHSEAVATVRIDSGAPESTDDAPTGWIAHPVEVVLTPMDAVSGVAVTYFRTGSSEWTTYTAPIGITDEGTTVLQYHSVDVKGNSEQTRSSEVMIDLSAPLTTSDAEQSYSETATIALTPSDAYSGVAKTEWKLDGGQWSEGSQIVVSTGGSHTIEWRSTDAVGNVEATKSATFDVYKNSEQTTADLFFAGTWYTTNNASLSGGSDKWTNSAGSVTVGFSGTGMRWIGTKSPFYGIANISIDGGAPFPVDMFSTGVEYQASVYSVTDLAPGRHTARIAWSGNKNAGSSGTVVRVDALQIVGTLEPADITAPVTSTNSDGKWRNTPLSVTMSSSDDMVGVASTHYRLDGGTVATYTASFSVSGEGTHTVEHWSRDKWGNVEATKTALVRIDLTAPITTTTAIASYDGTATIALNATDAHSGAGTTAWSLDGGAWVTGNSVQNSVPGPHTLDYRSTDTVGNTETVKRLVFDVRARHEQSSPNLHYTGTWYTTTNASLSGGSDAWINAAGSTTVAFNGTGARWIGTKSPFYGIANVSIDGGAPVPVDMYAKDVGYKSVIHEVKGLPKGDHTMQISWTGTKNAASNGTVVRVDALDVTGDIFAAGVRYENTSSLILYENAWYQSNNASVSAGSDSWTEQGSATVTFKGTAIHWIGTKSAFYGKARVSIDGGPLTEVDLYSPTTLYKQRLHSVVGLPNTTHTLYIEAANARNAASSGNGIRVDAFDIAGTLLQGQPPVPVDGTTRFEESESKLDLAGEWSYTTGEGLSGARDAWTQKGSATVAFTGTEVHWVATKAPYYGIAYVSIDGGAPLSVDLYSSGTIYRKRVFSATGLSDGSHTLRIDYSATKNPASTGTLIRFDAVDVRGTLESATVSPQDGTTRTEETAPAVAYSGDWMATNHYSLTGGADKWTKNGSAVVSFTGTEIHWVSAKSPYYGKAKVTLDDQAPVLVDLYGVGTTYKNRVFSATGLAGGEHQLTIEFTGEKNPASTGYVIRIDGFDTDGQLVAPQFGPSDGFSRREETTATLSYSSGWYSTSNATLSNGADKWTSTGYVQTLFSGTDVRWVCTKSPYYGMAYVTIDGGEPVLVDLYSVATLRQQVVFSATGLQPGTHTIRIEAARTRNPQATGNVIRLDALDVR